MKEICENLKYDTVRCSLNAQNNVLLLKGMDSLRAELKAAVRGRCACECTLLFLPCLMAPS